MTTSDLLQSGGAAFAAFTATAIESGELGNAVQFGVAVFITVAIFKMWREMKEFFSVQSDKMLSMHEKVSEGHKEVAKISADAMEKFSNKVESSHNKIEEAIMHLLTRKEK